MTKKRMAVVLCGLGLFALLIYNQLTVFVVQPIGAAPEGATLIISRLSGTQFIDSADAMCQRLQGSVNLLCRGMVLGQVMKNATVYGRLPYSDSLYLLSTGGVRYKK